MPRVFISYRRHDSAAHAGRIYDRLRDHFGAEQVFRDIDAITPGAKFAKVIAERIENCDALIAIIGKDWLSAEDGEGKRRLDDPDDWVKAEIREALTRDKLVIPVLVEGARMPKDSELPAEIAALAGCHAIEISESRFDYDTDRLLGAVAGKAASDAPPPKRSGGIWNWINDEKRQRTLSFLGVGTAALVAGLWTAYIHFSTPEKPSQAVAARPGRQTNACRDQNWRFHCHAGRRIARVGHGETQNT